MVKTIFILNIILALFGYVPYISSILKNRIHPHAFSWLPWFIITGIAFISQIKNDAWYWAWNLGLVSLGCLIIFVLSLYYWERNITSSDKYSLTASLAIIAVWLATNNDLLAVSLVCLVDIIAFYPTWRKSYMKPFEEDALIYALGSLRSLLSIFLLHNISLVNWLFPAITVLINGALVLYLVVRRRIVSK